MPDEVQREPVSGSVSQIARAARYLGDHVVGAVVALAVAGALGAGFALVQSDDDPDPTSQAPDGKNCPNDFPVKGNVSEDGERIYHEPGWRYYQATYPDKCFDTAASAEEEGYRASKVK